MLRGRPTATVLPSLAISTAGGRFESMLLMLPPRVVRRRSICQTDSSEPDTASVCPWVVSVQVTFWVLLKSFGTVILKTSLWRRTSKCVG